MHIALVAILVSHVACLTIKRVAPVTILDSLLALLSNLVALPLALGAILVSLVALLVPLVTATTSTTVETAINQAGHLGSTQHT